MGIQAFVAELAVETLQVSVLHRLARFDEIQRDVVLIGPGVKRLAGELGAVIQGDPLRDAMPQHHLRQAADDALTW